LTRDRSTVNLLGKGLFLIGGNHKDSKSARGPETQRKGKRLGGNIGEGPNRRKGESPCKTKYGIQRPKVGRKRGGNERYTAHLRGMEKKGDSSGKGEGGKDLIEKQVFGPTDKIRDLSRG